MRTERDFLHDLATPLAIADGKARMLQIKLKENPAGVTPAMIDDYINKVTAALAKAIELLRVRREEVRSAQQDQQNKA